MLRPVSKEQILALAKSVPVLGQHLEELAQSGLYLSNTWKILPHTDETERTLSRWFNRNRGELCNFFHESERNCGERAWYWVVRNCYDEREDKTKHYGLRWRIKVCLHGGKATRMLKSLIVRAFVDTVAFDYIYYERFDSGLGKVD